MENQQDAFFKPGHFEGFGVRKASSREIALRPGGRLMVPE
jgi:hypothetical protein